MGLVQLVLKGKLRGYGVGLVQLMRDWPCPEFPCPDVFARHLLEMVLYDFRETGHHYLMHLVAERQTARRRGTAEDVIALSAQIHEHAIHEQIPQRWWLDFLFSEAGYRMFGEYILPFWATVLIQLCTLEQQWEGVLLGFRPENPYLLAGFHPDAEVFGTAWLEDARRTWSEEVQPVPPAMLSAMTSHALSPVRDPWSSTPTIGPLSSRGGGAISNLPSSRSGGGGFSSSNRIPTTTRPGSQGRTEMATSWRLKATTIEGGFALRLIGDGDLGEAFDAAESVEVVMEDGRSLPLYDAMLALISSRVTGFIVLTERPNTEVNLDGARRVKGWVH